MSGDYEPAISSIPARKVGKYMVGPAIMTAITYYTNLATTLEVEE